MKERGLMREGFYLDNAATTRPIPEARAAVACAMEGIYGNPSSQHGQGIAAERALEEARRGVAGAAGVPARDLFFMASGSEANNCAIFGACMQLARRSRHVLTTRAEHASVLRPVEELGRQGWEVEYVDVGADGVADVGMLEERLRPDTALVALTHVNSETGAEQPIGEVCRARARKSPGTLVFVDCAQSFCKLPLDFIGGANGVGRIDGAGGAGGVGRIDGAGGAGGVGRIDGAGGANWAGGADRVGGIDGAGRANWAGGADRVGRIDGAGGANWAGGADMASFSSHKIHGPKGVAALYRRAGVKLRPFVFGGGQEGGLRSGTENVPGALGFAAAARALSEGRERNLAHAAALGSRLAAGLDAAGLRWRRVPGGEASSPYIFLAAFPGVPAEVLLYHLDSEGVYVSSGSACSSRSPIKAGSHVLRAMGLPQDVIAGAVRISFSPYSTEADVDAAVRALAKHAPALAKGFGAAPRRGEAPA